MHPSFSSHPAFLHSFHPLFPPSPHFPALQSNSIPAPYPLERARRRRKGGEKGGGEGGEGREGGKEGEEKGKRGGRGGEEGGGGLIFGGYRSEKWEGK